MSTSTSSVNAPAGGFFGRALGYLQSAAGVARRVVRRVVGFVTDVASTVASAATALYAAASVRLSQAGVSLSKVTLYAGSAACLTATALLFTTGLPALVVPAACLLAVAWLTRDAVAFVREHADEARAEAVLRLSGVVCLGAVLLAATASAPVLGGLAVSCIATGAVYKLICSDAGRWEIEQRWGQPVLAPSVN